jgi:hypothetical protein
MLNYTCGASGVKSIYGNFIVPVSPIEKPHRVSTRWGYFAASRSRPAYYMRLSWQAKIAWSLMQRPGRRPSGP